MTPEVVACGGTRVAHYPPGSTYGPVTLHDFEFVWLLSGTSIWQSGQRRLHLRPGMLLLTRPGTTHQFSWDAEAPSAHAYVHFSLDAGGDDVADWPDCRTLSPGDPLAALCRYLLRLGADPSPASAVRQRAVLGWLLELFADPLVADPRGERSLDPYLRRLVEHIAGRWRDGVACPVPVAELAAAAGVSAGHLARLFRARYRVGPAAALEMIRMARAAVLLRHSNLRIEDVGSACGFVSAFHFSRRFRHTYGIPPSSYRTMDTPPDPEQPLTRAGLTSLAAGLLFGQDA
ncbi:AraC family transcriptional regulator [Micromonospora sp. NPDC050200]|uniref:AraC family transcriptional regulator n=1 Tax=Micromonospora sp. NPDC050200 TaxID=3155664 RepID=UPI0033E03485